MFEVQFSSQLCDLIETLMPWSQVAEPYKEIIGDKEKRRLFL